jgi:tetratricopeptide (TPR) repeat protein
MVFGTTVIILWGLNGCGTAGAKTKNAPELKKYNPEAMTHIIQGSIADLMGQSKDALFEYHQAAELDTTSAGIYVALAENYYMLEKYPAAIRLAQKALRVDPANLDALELLAVCYEKSDDLKNATSALKRMVKLQPDNLEYLFNQLSLEIMSHEYKQALKDYFSLVKKGLDDIDYRLRIGHLFLQQKAFNEAEQVYLDVYRKNPDQESVYLALAATSKAKADTAAAMEWYHKALQKNPKFNDVKAELQLILENKKMWDAAIKIFQELVAGDSTNLGNKIQLGQYYLLKGDTLQALQLFNKVVAEHPKREKSYLVLAAVQKIAGDTTAAIATYKAGLAVKSNFYAIRKKLSEIYASKKQWPEAMALYEAIQDNDTTHVGARIEIANLFAQKGDSVKAFEECKLLLQDHPDDWRVPLTLGRLYYAARHYSLAAKSFKKTIELRTDLPNLWVLEGISYVQMDSLEQAHDAFDQALKKFPDSAELYYYMATVLVRLKMLNQSIPYFQKAIDLDPDNQQTLVALAGAYDELSRYDLSEPIYIKLLERNPNNAVILNNYAYHLSVRGVRLTEALEMVKKALEADPDNSPYLDTLGWIYYQKGEFDQAKIYIEKALQIRADAPDVLEHMGDVYQKLGDQKSAQYYWNKALEVNSTRQELQKKLGNVQK